MRKQRVLDSRDIWYYSNSSGDGGWFAVRVNNFQKGVADNEWYIGYTRDYQIVVTKATIDTTLYTRGTRGKREEILDKVCLDGDFYYRDAIGYLTDPEWGNAEEVKVGKPGWLEGVMRQRCTIRLDWGQEVTHQLYTVKPEEVSEEEARGILKSVVNTSNCVYNGSILRGSDLTRYSDAVIWDDWMTSDEARMHRYLMLGGWGLP